MMDAAARPFRPSRRVALLLVALALLGWGGFGLGLVLAPPQAWLAYLAAYVYVVTCALGALCLVMVAHTTGARWFILVRRLAETISAALPLLALLFIPVLLVVPTIYPWAAPAALDAHARELVARKQAYLNVPFFIARAVAYLAVWSLLALVLRRWSLRQDRLGAAASLGWIAGVSGAGLMLFGFTITFAAFDWVMSLAPTWQSSIFGMYVFAGSMTAALGALIVLAYLFARRGDLAGHVAAAHFHALGRLLLTFVALWAYIAYSQGMLIWIADIPEEVHFFTRRVAGGWGVLLILLGVGHFLLPFLLLLSRPIKRSGAALACIGAWMLVMHYVDVCWLILPALHGPGGAHWVELPALLAVGATAALGAGWSLVGHPPVPLRDPRLGAALEYRSP